MKTFLSDKSGNTFTEYGLILGISCVFLIVVFSGNSGIDLNDTFNLLNKVL